MRRPFQTSMVRGGGKYRGNLQPRWTKTFTLLPSRVAFDSVPSLHVSCLKPGPGGGIGRRYGLKIRFANASASSSLAPGTNKNNNLWYFYNIPLN